MAVEILPAVLASRSATLRRRWQRAVRLRRTVHLDVMDGQFVPGRSPDASFFLTLPFGRTPVEWHLMVNDPISWLPVIKISRAKRVVLHVELGRRLAPAVKAFQTAHIPVSLAINPSTSTQLLKPWYRLIKGVVVMGVRPGRYGARFQAKALLKAAQVHTAQPRLPLTWDGGIRPTTLPLVLATGARQVVVGSFLVAADNPKSRLKQLQKIGSASLSHMLN